MWKKSTSVRYSEFRLHIFHTSVQLSYQRLGNVSIQHFTIQLSRSVADVTSC